MFRSITFRYLAGGSITCGNLRDRVMLSSYRLAGIALTSRLLPPYFAAS